MKPGPRKVIACPHCGGFASHSTLISGNTFSTTYWTDSKAISPMLPVPPAIIRCISCRGFYWRSDGKDVTLSQPLAFDFHHGEPVSNENGLDVWPAEEPSENEYYLAIEEGIANTAKQERFVRTLAWWRRNDRYRTTPSRAARARNSIGIGIQGHSVTRVVMSAGCRANLHTLMGLLTESNMEDRIRKAEIFRELGQFDRASAILETVDTPKLAPAVGQIHALCRKKDRCVRQLLF